MLRQEPHHDVVGRTRGVGRDDLDDFARIGLGKRRRSERQRQQRRNLYPAGGHGAPGRYFVALKSMALTTAATLACCSAMESANSRGPPTLRTWPVAFSRSPMLPSAAAARTSAAIFSLSSFGRVLMPITPTRPSTSS